MSEDPDFKYIIRIANSDVSGEERLGFALTSIRGVGPRICNAIIQKLPIIGNILVGGEGEGMFSIDFTLTGDQDDPDVNSVPLSIIKPRIIERAVELVETSN